MAPLNTESNRIIENGSINGVRASSSVQPQEPLFTSTVPGGEHGNGHMAYRAPEQELHITEFLRGKTYLVTGVTGFMGTVLVCTCLLQTLTL